MRKLVVCIVRYKIVLTRRDVLKTFLILQFANTTGLNLCKQVTDTFAIS